MNIISVTAAPMAATILFILLILHSVHAQTRARYLADVPNFDPRLAPQQLPGDVDIALEQQLPAEKKRPRVQRLFDLWSWQAFIALNGPDDPQRKKLSDGKNPVLPARTLWTESSSPAANTLQLTGDFSGLFPRKRRELRFAESIENRGASVSARYIKL